jgi:hypothetical protein
VTREGGDVGERGGGWGPEAERKHSPGLLSPSVPRPSPAADPPSPPLLTTEADVPEHAAGEARPAAARRTRRLRALANCLAVRDTALAVCYVAAGIVVTWPRAAYRTGRLPASGDVSSYVWDLWWVAHQVTHLGNPWFTSQMAAPEGLRLGFDTTMPLAGLVMTPVTLAFGPSASLAVLTALTPGLACYAMYRAARLWLRGPAGAIAAGGFFGLSTMLCFQTWYHLNVALGAVFLPMALEASIRLRHREEHCDRRRAGVILGLVLGASVLVNLETAVMAAGLAGLVLAPGLARDLLARDLLARDLLARDLLARDLLARDLLARGSGAALAVLVAVVVASPQLAAVATAALADGVARPDVRGYVKYAAGLPGLFAPSPRVGAFGLHGLASVFQTGAPGEGIPTFGVVLTVLAAAGLGVSWRRGSAWRLAALWLGAGVLALGATLHVGHHDYVPLGQVWDGVRVSALMPYTWLVRIPGLSGFREPDRLALLGLVPAALLAGSAVDRLRGWGQARSRVRGPAAVAVVAALGLLEAGWSGSAGVGVMTAALPALDQPIAADHSRSIVLDVPFGLRGGLHLYGQGIAPQALLLATADGHARAVAYTSWVPGPTAKAVNRQSFYRGLVTAQDRRPTSAALLAAARRDARRLDIGWVLVWPTPSRRSIRARPAVLRYLAATGFHFDYRADGVLVYRPG